MPHAPPRLHRMLSDKVAPVRVTALLKELELDLVALKPAPELERPGPHACLLREHAHISIINLEHVAQVEVREQFGDDLRGHDETAARTVRWVASLVVLLHEKGWKFVALNKILYIG